MSSSTRVVVAKMGTITEALECSLQKSHQQPLISSSSSSSSFSSSSSSIHQHQHQQSTSLDLNSHLSLPYHWEQCLDLKTGEIYYINWRNGMKAKEDPRSTIIDEDYQDDEYSEDYCYYYSDDHEEEDDISSYDSEESSTESTNMRKKKKTFVVEEEEEKDVLVVGGCKRCLMYFMVPKHLQDCPKCNNGQLLHFDRSQNHIIP
uniref:GIR1-like zinc ribbon domain-containing protein n=1 Tax=Cucumis sativus TaxID=3659 RepID=A0A0A0KTY3_CUCSA